MDFYTSGKSDCFHRSLARHIAKHVTTQAGALSPEALVYMPLYEQRVRPSPP